MKVTPELRKKADRAGLLDRAGDFAVQLCGNTGHATRKDLTGFSRELREKLRIGGDHLIGRDIMPATRHLAVRFAERNTTLDSFRLRHENLAKFAVKGATLKEVIEFHFFETTGCTQALFVARCDVTGRRLALSLGFGAFKNNNVAWHGKKLGRGNLS